MLNFIFTKLFLWPFSCLVEFVARVRRFAYNYGLLKRNSFEVPIISVGNLTFGGTGKTPVTLWIAKYLLQQNKKVMILMRGYKGEGEKSTKILQGGRRMGGNPAEYGDEALLLSRKLKGASIVVGRDRSGNLDYYFDRELPDIVLLDDGHQHLKLERNLNIVLFDALMSLSRYRTAPLGYMREGLSALRDADIAIVGRVEQAPLHKVERLERLIQKHLPPESLLVRMRYRVTGVFYGNSNERLDPGRLAGMKVICVSGIASTESFYKTVESLGLDIIKKHSFPDHHFFTSQEFNLFMKEAEEMKAGILTTEKDIVKMRILADTDKIYYLGIEVEFIDGEEKVKDIISRVACL